jgi:hypothetical protein
VPVLLGILDLLKIRSPSEEGTPLVQAITTRPRIIPTTDGAGVVSHAGSRLLADVADATGVSAALAGLRVRRAGHDPGRCSPMWP